MMLSAETTATTASPPNSCMIARYRAIARGFDGEGAYFEYGYRRWVPASVVSTGTVNDGVKEASPHSSWLRVFEAWFGTALGSSPRMRRRSDAFRGWS